MLESVLHVAEYKLTDLLSSAGATIGVIIAGTIFLQFLSTKYLDLAGRYRGLTGEYRGHEEGNRHDLLQELIRSYRRRLWSLLWASWLAAVALICFILAVLAGGLSMAYPGTAAFKWVGSAGLLFGLLLICSAVFLNLAESLLARHELAAEVGDLDEDARRVA